MKDTVLTTNTTQDKGFVFRWAFTIPVPGLGAFWPYVTMSVEQEDLCSAPPAASGILRHIDVERLFNLPLYEHHLVIDTRSANDYSSGHIVSAVSYPSPPRTSSDLEREKTLIKFIKGYVKEYFR